MASGIIDVPSRFSPALLKEKRGAGSSHGFLPWRPCFPPQITWERRRSGCYQGIFFSFESSSTDIWYTFIYKPTTADEILPPAALKWRGAGGGGGWGGRGGRVQFCPRIKKLEWYLEFSMKLAFVSLFILARWKENHSVQLYLIWITIWKWLEEGWEIHKKEWSFFFVEWTRATWFFLFF